MNTLRFNITPLIISAAVFADATPIRRRYHYYAAAPLLAA